MPLSYTTFLTESLPNDQVRTYRGYETALGNTPGVIFNVQYSRLSLPLVVFDKELFIPGATLSVFLGMAWVIVDDVALPYNQRRIVRTFTLPSGQKVFEVYDTITYTAPTTMESVTAVQLYTSSGNPPFTGIRDDLNNGVIDPAWTQVIGGGLSIVEYPSRLRISVGASSSCDWWTGVNTACYIHRPIALPRDLDIIVHVTLGGVTGNSLLGGLLAYRTSPNDGFLTGLYSDGAQTYVQVAHGNGVNWSVLTSIGLGSLYDHAWLRIRRRGKTMWGDYCLAPYSITPTENDWSEITSWDVHADFSPLQNHIALMTKHWNFLPAFTADFRYFLQVY